MEYRIKVVVDGNNSTMYYPQYKKWGLWWYFINWDSCPPYGLLRHSTIEKNAFEIINQDIEKRRAKKTKSIEYIYKED